MSESEVQTSETKPEPSSSPDAYYYVHVELARPLSFGNRKQSYLQFLCESSASVTLSADVLYIQLADYETAIPIDNVVLWRGSWKVIVNPYETTEPMGKHRLAESVKFHSYGEPVGGWLGWYENDNGDCVAFLGEDDKVVFIDQLK